jgi:hypothetical protein
MGGRRGGSPGVGRRVDGYVGGAPPLARGGPRAPLGAAPVPGERDATALRARLRAGYTQPPIRGQRSMNVDQDGELLPRIVLEWLRTVPAVSSRGQPDASDSANEHTDGRETDYPVITLEL